MGKPYSMNLRERVVLALRGQRRPAEFMKCVHSINAKMATPC
jgi:hypothetical protein